MTNIRQVAKLAGVSVATVSRVFSDPDIVSENTRDKVSKAAEEAGYKPNMLARNFRAKKSFTIVVLVPDISNPFFSRVITGIQRAAKDNGYAVLLGNTGGSARREEEYTALVHTYQADGIIQLSARYPFKEGEEFVGGAAPIVNACECYDTPATPSVQLDNNAASAAMVQHLLELGHRRIAAVQGPTSSPLTRERLKGYRAALEGAGVGFDPNLIATGDFTMASGEKAAGALMALDKRPTAIFCMSDEMAIGVLKGLKKMEFSVPSQVSVAGFDDIDFASFTDPMLTTIAQPAEDFGTTAVALLMERLNGGSSISRHVSLPFNLVVRGSTGPAPV